MLLGLNRPFFPKQVASVAASEAAFAAVRADGRVVCWGHPHFGGEPLPWSVGGFSMDYLNGKGSEC